MPSEGFGMHYYGITKIEQQGAVIAEQLFCSLVNMFSLAPEIIELTGQFQWGRIYFALRNLKMMNKYTDNSLSF
ncbi:hypothetical protein EC917_12221 [Bacillus thuringiensis]|uniref:Uncharacterized protein n=1 Tax=Bacillus thuringiensis TaxID=1428 RepID=A0A4R4BID5_BACTU|nr:hypothetical protein [Bacillus thuringiensis]TCW48274.1 hypothetical protein EC917_12221 [Bacillus thuringiensis]TCW57450.1 hypothetical protein EC910_10380 [Bacillus thuringiensis]